MTKQGRVIKTNGDTAIISAVRESACGENCAHCKGNCSKSSITFYAKNKINAKEGDTVLVYADTKKVLFSSFCLYVLPVILIIISIFAGSLIFKSDLISIALCITLLTLWIFIIKLVNKINIEHILLKVVNKND